MNTRITMAVAVLAAGAWLSSAAPARAQLASYVNEEGKVIYINGNSLPMHQTTTLKTSLAVQPPTQKALTVAKGRLFSTSQPSDERLDRIVREAAERHALDPALVKAVITTESGWNSRAVSNKGAVGLMQLIPGTAQRYGVGNAYDPEQNVEGGTSYLRWLLDRYNGDLAKSLAAYNAGEHAVDQSGGIPRYPETRRYVQKVTNTYFNSDGATGSAFWNPPHSVVRPEPDATGRVIFTNQ
jgi:soluble lytic murein transglycosylase-like protein